MRRTNAAVIGTGFIGPVHVEALRRLGIPVVGLLGSSPERTAQATARMGVPKAYHDLDALLADDAVDVVHIATPNNLHFAMASAALEAGKHVMVEKPLAMTSAETERLVGLARAAGRAAGVTYNIRFYPLCQEARARVARGDLGEVTSVCGSYVQDWLLYPTDYNWRVLAGEGGALRALADIGTHWLDLVQAITGLEVVAVLADLATVHPVRQRPRGEVQTFAGKQALRVATELVTVTTEDYGGVMLRFANGARGVLWVSQVTAGRKNCLRFEVAGTHSALAWSSETPNDLWIGHRDCANETLTRDPALLSGAARSYAAYPGGHNEGFADTFKQCFRAFYEYVRAGDFRRPTTFATFEDGHREVLLCEAILTSAREGQWIEV